MGRNDIQLRFENFHHDHPEVYEYLVELTFDLKTKGFQHYGLRSVWERVRWHFLVERTEEFKVNDNYISRYARMIMKANPQLDGFFETRKLHDVFEMPRIVIGMFQGKHDFLSNFFIEPDGTHVEGEYQAAKYSDDVQRRVFDMLTPTQCKKYGRKVSLRPDWEQAKLTIMEGLVMAKFVDHPELRDKLLATGDAELVEGNTWRDFFWGVCDGQGENHLGKILMGVRDWIR